MIGGKLHKIEINLDEEISNFNSSKIARYSE